MYLQFPQHFIPTMSSKVLACWRESPACKEAYLNPDHIMQKGGEFVQQYKCKTSGFCTCSCFDPTFGIHSHKTIDTALPRHLLKPNCQPSSSHSSSAPFNISTQFLRQLFLCACMCVCMHVCSHYNTLCKLCNWVHCVCPGPWHFNLFFSVVLSLFLLGGSFMALIVWC